LFEILQLPLILIDDFLPGRRIGFDALHGRLAGLGPLHDSLLIHDADLHRLTSLRRLRRHDQHQGAQHDDDTHPAHNHTSTGATDTLD